MTSIFDIYKIGIGPSSSHTVGPMLAALRVLDKLKEDNLIQQVERVQLFLYGSLALTGQGHGSDMAICLGMEGYHPRSVDTTHILDFWQRIKDEKTLNLNGEKIIRFDYTYDLIFEKAITLEYHSNGMRFKIEGTFPTREYTYYSIGGGFIEEEGASLSPHEKKTNTYNDKVPFPFSNAAQLQEICETKEMSIDEVMLRNELVFHSQKTIEEKTDEIVETMMDAIRVSLTRSGGFYGGLSLQRRAKSIYGSLLESKTKKSRLEEIDWISMYAIAVNEENATFGRVVTAPTNGSAGVVPAVIKYLLDFEDATQEDIRRFIYASAAIGAIFKFNASISGAEVGCQGEVGVACSMAASGFVTAKYCPAPHKQVINAAEIGIEHNLGLTCDPIGGLVLVPCIERNAIGAVKAIQAAKIAILNKGKYFISLDDAVKTMKKTGEDMSNQYKETSLGGLAVNTTFC